MPEESYEQKYGMILAKIAGTIEAFESIEEAQHANAMNFKEDETKAYFRGRASAFNSTNTCLRRNFPEAVKRIKPKSSDGD